MSAAAISYAMRLRRADFVPLSRAANPEIAGFFAGHAPPIFGYRLRNVGAVRTPPDAIGREAGVGP
jgi:hypothetical protein